MEYSYYSYYGRCRSLKLRGRRTARARARAVRMKVKKLQRLIPGGKGLQAERLFLKTAHYISHLRLQLHALETLSSTLHLHHH